MMRCNTFGRSALFAALAALAWLPWMIIAGPLVGVWNARALYLIALTVLYVAGLAPHSSRRLMLILVVGSVAGSVALVAHATADLAIGLAGILGITRSVFLYRAAPARAVAVEVTLLVSGLLFARFLAGASLASTAFAVWGFLLVQSLFFVIAGARERGPAPPRPDPFDEAYRRALAVLEREGV